jgi:hypothetical protein
MQQEELLVEIMGENTELCRVFTASLKTATTGQKMKNEN